jgi:hypothetical protein
MLFHLSRELNCCLSQHPDEAAEAILERVRFRTYVKTGKVPPDQHLAAAVALLRKFDPDEPRVSAGNSTGGEWTSEGDGSDSDLALLETCETQLYLDGLICTRLNSKPCWAQANFRYSACLRGDPIPYFPYK